MKRSICHTYLAIAGHMAVLLLTFAILLCALPVVLPFMAWELYEQSCRPLPEVQCSQCKGDCKVTSLAFGVWEAYCEHCDCHFTSPRLSNEEMGRQLFKRMRNWFSKTFRFPSPAATKTGPQQHDHRCNDEFTKPLDVIDDSEEEFFVLED